MSDGKDWPNAIVCGEKDGEWWQDVVGSTSTWNKCWLEGHLGCCSGGVAQKTCHIHGHSSSRNQFQHAHKALIILLPLHLQYTMKLSLIGHALVLWCFQICNDDQSSSPVTSPVKLVERPSRRWQLRAGSAIQGSVAGLSNNRGHEGQFRGYMDSQCCVLTALAAVNETQIKEKTPGLQGKKR